MQLRALSVLLISCIALFTLSPAWGSQSATPISVENAANVQQVALLEGHTGPVFSLAFSPDGAMLVSGGSGDDYTVRLWDLPSASQKALLEGHTAQIAAVAFNADGTQVETASYDMTVRLWDAATGASTETISETADEFPEMLSISNLATYFNADGSQLAYFSGIGIDVFDLTRREQRTIGENAPELFEVFSGANIVRVSDDGKIAAVEIPDGGPIHLIDVETETEIKTLERSDPDSYYFTAIAFSPDGKMIAAVDDTSLIIQVWNVETGEPGPLLSGHAPNTQGTMGVYGLNFSPDGSLLASASYDGTVRIWDVTAGTELAALETSGEGGSAVVVWSPDGSRLASANLDGTIQLWGVPG